MVDDTQRDSDLVPHQRLQEEVIDERLDGVTSENVAITNAVAAVSSPTQTEFNNLVTKFNALLGACRSSGIIPS